MPSGGAPRRPLVQAGGRGRRDGEVTRHVLSGQSARFDAVELLGALVAADRVAVVVEEQDRVVRVLEQEAVARPAALHRRVDRPALPPDDRERERRCQRRQQHQRTGLPRAHACDRGAEARGLRNRDHEPPVGTGHFALRTHERLAGRRSPDAPEHRKVPLARALDEADARRGNRQPTAGEQRREPPLRVLRRRDVPGPAAHRSADRDLTPVAFQGEERDELVRPARLAIAQRTPGGIRRNT